MTAPAPWRLVRRRGPASRLHGDAPPPDAGRRVVVLDPDSPAVVLGSTQPLEVVDHAAAAAAGLDVVRRRSGGGAVLVGPADPIWVDVVIPRGDPLWDDDVGRSFLPVGRAWSRALGAAGIAPTSVHDGPMRTSRWSSVLCFAGVGPGEVLGAGPKVVGISQRRTRHWAWFQCAVHRTWDPAPLCAVLADGPSPHEVADVAVGVGDLDREELVHALVEALTTNDLR